MKRIDGVPCALLKGGECDAEKKRFAYLKTPIKGLYYIPSDVERKSRTLSQERFVPALLAALQKGKRFRLHFGIITSARNCGLSWRPARFVEVFNDKKTFWVDFSKFASKYGALRSYYSKALSRFYSSLSIKRLLFRKVALLPASCLAYDDRYLAGFYITRECAMENAKRYAPRHARKCAFLKNEYATLVSDMEKMA
jgi:hypothetical protein